MKTSIKRHGNILRKNGEGLTKTNNGNMTSVTNSCGTTSYDWDARNRLGGINGYKPDCTPLTASFEYDALGRRIEKTINGRTIQYLYDGIDIVQEIDNGRVTVNYTYDNDGLLTGTGAFTITRNAGNGLPETVTGEALNITRTFNGYGKLENQNFVVNALNLTSWGVTRDRTGRITAKTETVQGATSNYAYTYDSKGRLLTVTKEGTLIEEYQYDTIGRRTYEMNALKGITGRTFTYSDEDHLLTAGDTTYQSDLDGFLNAKTQGTNFTYYDYSSRGELLSVTLPDGKLIEYVNDPLGQRIAKKVNGVVVEKYFWQGLTRLLAVYDGGDNLVMRFEYADARMPIAVTKGGITYYLTYDQVGSLRSVTDASGNIVKRIDYDSSGSILSDTNPGFTIPFGFAGGLHDRDTGLVKFGFRDYDPNVGRWNAKDPILFAGRDVDFYVYVGNNPVNFIDPLGLYSWNDFMDDWSTVADIRAAQNYWQNYGGQAGSVMSGLLSFSGLATVQESGETLGDPCKSTGQKVWAGAKIVGVGASWYLAGSTQVTGQVAGQVRTSRIIGLRNKFGEHFFTDENGFFFALDRTFHRLHIGPWKTWFTK